MAVSASSAKFVSQCLFLVCRLYLGPLFSRSSFGDGYVCVIDQPGEEGVGVCWGVVVCCWVSLSNLLSSVLFLDLIVFWRLSSVRSWM
jgi:hypothetical protein